MVKGATFGRVLDIGCGDGSISLPLLTHENHITLLDMSEQMLQRARSRIPAEKSGQVEIFNGDFMSVNLPPASYDLIVCLGVLAYVPVLSVFLNKVDSLLKAGGHVIIEWTDSRCVLNRLWRPYHWIRSRLIAPTVRLAAHDTDEVVGAFRALKFELADSFRYCSPAPGLRKLLSEDLNYRLIRALNGFAGRNHRAWMGDECIFYFRKPLAPALFK